MDKKQRDRQANQRVGLGVAIGLVIARDPDSIAGDPFFPAFIAGVESTLGPAGMSLVIKRIAVP